MLEKIYALIKEALDLDADYELAPAMGTDDIEEWDSFGLMSIFGLLEQTFGIRLTFEEMSQIETIQDIVNILHNRGMED